MRYDWVVVGAGFTGAAFARAQADRGRKVLLVEARATLGGNAYDEYDDAGILVHRYGPHIFHTNSDLVWEFLSRFTEWHEYNHHVRAWVDGCWIPLPFNLNSLERVFPPRLVAELTEGLVKAFGFGTRVPILKLRETGDAQASFLAEYVYEKVFLHYTQKQWGLPPDALDPSVMARVPVLLSRDDRYFQDRYQAMPSRGFARLFSRMLDHPCIHLLLNAPFSQVAASLPKTRLLFTGRIDDYFSSSLGPLPYRSIRMESVTRALARFQDVAVHNYPNDQAYTRITEWKTLTVQASAPSSATSLCYEYPEPFEPGKNEPYYPIPMQANRGLHAAYCSLAEREAPHVIFAGRLGDYQYYNMDQAVARALTLAEKT